MPTSFEKQIEVRWSDCDANQHVRHSAYYDYGAHVRIRYFMAAGFGPEKLTEIQIGPILFKEECSFIREIHLDDILRVNVLRGDIKEDGSKWVLHHELFNQHGQKVAHLSMNGAFMDLQARKLTVPPVELAEALKDLPHGEAYAYKK